MTDNPPDDGFIRLLAVIGDSGVPAEAARGFANVLTSLAQSAATSPYAAGATTIITASMLKRMGAIDNSAKLLLYAGGAGAMGTSVASGLADLADTVQSVLPFSGDTAVSNTTSVSFDIPDFGAGPRRGGFGGLAAGAPDARFVDLGSGPPLQLTAGQ